jgi:hypothetical protein
VQVSADLRDVAQWNRYHVCGLPVLQALWAWPGRDRECLWIPGLAGIKGSFDREGLRGWSLG